MPSMYISSLLGQAGPGGYAAGAVPRVGGLTAPGDGDDVDEEGEARKKREFLGKAVGDQQGFIRHAPVDDPSSQTMPGPQELQRLTPNPTPSYQQASSAPIERLQSSGPNANAGAGGAGGASSIPRVSPPTPAVPDAPLVRANEGGQDLLLPVEIPRAPAPPGVASSPEQDARVSNRIGPDVRTYAASRQPQFTQFGGGVSPLTRKTVPGDPARAC